MPQLQMARAESNVRIVPSVFDRLLDDAPWERTDPPTDLRQALGNLRHSVARDLETLLNTRRDPLAELDALPNLRRSLATYGLPDFAVYSLNSDTDRATIRREVEEAIATFEPRLKNVRVILESDIHQRALSFRIDALLQVDPVPEPVVFDAVVEWNPQRVKVKG